MSDFLIDKSKTVCFSGHRPEKLPFQGVDTHYANKTLKSLIYAEIAKSIEEGFDCFITGLARGIDLWAGEMVLEIKEKDPRIKLAAVFPYAGFTDKYKGYEKWICGNIKNKADAFFCIKQNYDRSCMRERNIFMVDNSAKLIAVLADGRSGTGQTVRYAQKRGIKVVLHDIAALAPPPSYNYDEAYF